MPDELPAGDTATPQTLVVADEWELQDIGRVRATPEEVARDLAADFDTPAPPAPDPDGTVLEAPARPDADVQDHDTFEDTDDPDPGDVTPAPKAEAKPEPKADEPGKRTLDGRIKTKQAELGRLAAEKREAEAEVERLRAAAAALKAGTEPKAAPAPAAPAPEALKKPVWAEFEAADKSWDDFVVAQDAYYEAKTAAIEAKIEAKLTATEAARVERDATVRVEAMHQARIDAARAAHADFDEAVDGWDEVPVVPFLRDAVMWHPQGAEMYYQIGKQPEVAAVLADLTYTNEMMDAVMASANPAALLVHLAENPAEYTRLVQLPPRQALVAFGALDARLTAAPAPSPATPTASPARAKGVPVSQAKPPIRPVGSGSRPTSTDADPDDMDFGPDYVRAMNVRERGAGV